MALMKLIRFSVLFCISISLQLQSLEVEANSSREAHEKFLRSLVGAEVAREYNLAYGELSKNNVPNNPYLPGVFYLAGRSVAQGLQDIKAIEVYLSNYYRNPSYKVSDGIFIKNALLKARKDLHSFMFASVTNLAVWKSKLDQNKELLTVEPQLNSLIETRKQYAATKAALLETRAALEKKWFKKKKIQQVDLLIAELKVPDPIPEGAVELMASLQLARELLNRFWAGFEAVEPLTEMEMEAKFVFLVETGQDLESKIPVLDCEKSVETKNFKN